MSSLAIKYCVLIPTYNNAGTLLEVINSVKEFTNEILIVNDGSTDNTKAILNKVEKLHLINFEKNKGKGKALREGFKMAIDLGYTHVITLDSDGQHKASDLPKFFKAIEKKPYSLFIGSRNMNQTNVPGSSSFGNNFSNFWFKFETGISAPDTQSGFRSYPVHLYKNTRFYTNKYELEIEVIVRSAWKDIPIEFVEIDVYYPPEEERITHFRKIPDFTRISILNTVLVALAILYYKPRNFIRDIKKKSGREFFKKYVLNSNEPGYKVLFSVFLGAFIGFSPFHGFKLMSIITLSFLLKLNKTISIGVSYITGMPPIIPLLIFVSHEIGALVLQNNNHLIFAHRNELTLQFIWENVFQQFVGGLIFASVSASLLTFVAYCLLIIPKKKAA